MIFLLIGGAGFIGRTLVEHITLRFPDSDVYIVDNLSTGDISKLEGRVVFEFFKADSSKPEELRPVLEHVLGRAKRERREVYIIHLAAIPTVDISSSGAGGLSLIEYHSSNSSSLIALLDILISLPKDIRGKATKLLFFSSAAVYGEQDALPIKETAKPNPKTPYALDKLCAEGYLRYIGDKYGIPYTIVRPFNVYGLTQVLDYIERQGRLNPYSGVISVFVAEAVKALREGRKAKFKVFGDGRQTRDFINVHDLSEGVLHLLTRADLKVEIINLGTGRSTSILELAKAVAEAFELDYELLFLPPREGDIIHSLADVTLATEISMPRPKVELKSWLREVREKLITPQT